MISEACYLFKILLLFIYTIQFDDIKLYLNIILSLVKRNQQCLFMSVGSANDNSLFIPVKMFYSLSYQQDVRFAILLIFSKE